ncbi:hypothetical protein SSBG_06049 [Streptomyces sp. SPB074]|nr:hypothetical protein SSBG_06049 [Streptomyces sp. SPB074]
MRLARAAGFPLHPLLTGRYLRQYGGSRRAMPPRLGSAPHGERDVA